MTTDNRTEDQKVAAVRASMTMAGTRSAASRKRAYAAFSEGRSLATRQRWK